MPFPRPKTTRAQMMKDQMTFSKHRLNAGESIDPELLEEIAFQKTQALSSSSSTSSGVSTKNDASHRDRTFLTGLSAMSSRRSLHSKSNRSINDNGSSFPSAAMISQAKMRTDFSSTTSLQSLAPPITAKPPKKFDDPPKIIIGFDGLPLNEREKKLAEDYVYILQLLQYNTLKWANDNGDLRQDI